jgi:carboxyl-terminal processing protease
MSVSPSFRVPLALAVGILLGGGITLTHSVLADRVAPETIPYEDLAAFADILNMVKDNYVDKVDDKTLIQHALHGMLAGLDPHSGYLDKEENKEMNFAMTGKYGGLGIVVQPDKAGFVRVVSPIDDTPAARAGIQAGDLIIKIDDTSVKDLQLEEAVNKMKGEPGSKVTLTLVREKEAKPLVLTLTREEIKVPSVNSHIVEAGFGYLRITQFTVDTADGVHEQLAKLVKANNGEPLKGLILDLRNNPGGVLPAAVDVSDTFIDKGVIVSMKGRVADSNAEFDAKPGDELKGRPMLVLVNNGSASAAEIVAGALQDDHRALIVGQRTFGKGSVQTVRQLQDGSAVKLTTARYFTPSGRSIQAEGIMPDVVLADIKAEKPDPNEMADLFGTKEADLMGRLDNPDPVEAKKQEAAQAEAVKQHEIETKLAQSDFQLYQALGMLKGMAVADRLSSASAKP